MTDSPSSIEPIARWRLIAALIMSLGSASFTALWLAIFGFFLLQVFTGVCEGGELIFIGLFLTALPVCLLTLGALLLVGPKYCKLAWISAIAYAAPFIICLFTALWGR
jgi:hypothetical protein